MEIGSCPQWLAGIDSLIFRATMESRVRHIKSRPATRVRFKRGGIGRNKSTTPSRDSIRLQGLGVGAASVGATAVGAIALGAFAVGALAIGTLVIGSLVARRLKIRDARIGRLKVDDLAVANLHVGKLDGAWAAT